MKNTPIYRDTVDIIDILLNPNDYITLNNIIRILNKKSTCIRTLYYVSNII